jgi:predicted RNase H-like nuclease
MASVSSQGIAMKSRILVVLALVCGQALADPATDEQVRQLEAGLAGALQEQQAAYQNFQMVQELRRIELLGPPPLQGQAALYAPPQNYDDMVRAERERQERIEKYTADLARMYTRNQELQNQIRALRNQIMELKQRP